MTDTQQGPWRHRYNVSARVTTTPGTLHLEALFKGQQGGKCVADATGIFTQSGKEGVELEEARLGTNDIGELCTRGTRFFFALEPTGFRVAFHDEQQQERKLGELRARPLPVTGNPGFGVARWSRSDPPPQTYTTHTQYVPRTMGPLNWLLSLCKRKRKNKGKP